MFEYVSCLIDYSMFYYFYLQVKNEGHGKARVIVEILLFAWIEYYLTFFQIDRNAKQIISVLFIFLFIACLNKKFKLIDGVFCLTLYMIFGITIEILVHSCVFMFSMNMELTLIFGKESILFSILLKIITFMLLCFVVKPLKKLNYMKDQKFIITLLLFLAVSLWSMTYIIDYFEIDKRSLMITIIITVLFIVVYNLAIYYSVAIMEKEEANTVRQIMKISDEHVKEIEREQHVLNKIQHDTKNQLLLLETLYNKGKKEEFEAYLKGIIEEHTYRSPIAYCNNVYVDAILNQKANQYPEVTMNVDIVLESSFEMNIQDVTSLFFKYRR